MANEIEKNNGEIIIYQSEDGKIKLSLAEKLVDILTFVADKDQITTEEIVSHFGFNPTTAKRYLRQLTEFGYLEAHGGNKNRTTAADAGVREVCIVLLPSLPLLTLGMAYHIGLVYKILCAWDCG